MTLTNNRTHRTGWNELFAGSDRAILIKLSRIPSRTINGDLLVGKHEGRELRSPAADEMKLRRIPVGLNIALGGAGILFDTRTSQFVAGSVVRRRTAPTKRSSC
jgi:hypothetical protein